MKIAVVLKRKDSIRVVRGIGTRAQEYGLGNVLRIRLDADAVGLSEIVINEDVWIGELLPDTQYDCEFVLPLSAI